MKLLAKVQNRGLYTVFRQSNSIPGSDILTIFIRRTEKIVIVMLLGIFMARLIA